MKVSIWLNEDYSLEVNDDPYEDDAVVDMTPEDLARYIRMKKEYRDVQEMLSEYRKLQTQGTNNASR